MSATVFIHGWGFNARVWDAVREQHPGTVTTVNLPGFGGRPDTGEASLDAFARDVIAQAPEPAHWIGWSLGGVVALRVARLRPDLCERVTLCATSPRFVADDEWPGIQAAVLAAFADDLDNNIERTLARFIQLQTGAGCDRACVRAIRERLALLPAATRKALRRGLQLLRDTDLRHELASLSMPIHWLLGARDTLVPVALSEHLSRRYPQHRVSVLKNAGHAPFLDNPGVFQEWQA